MSIVKFSHFAQIHLHLAKSHISNRNKTKSATNLHYLKWSLLAIMEISAGCLLYFLFLSLFANDSLISCNWNKYAFVFACARLQDVFQCSYVTYLLFQSHALIEKNNQRDEDEFNWINIQQSIVWNFFVYSVNCYSFYCTWCRCSVIFP